MTDDTDTRIAFCDSCGERGEWFSRWHYMGMGDAHRRYVWIQCPGIPPCNTGPCHQLDEDALAGWNKLMDETRR